MKSAAGRLLLAEVLSALFSMALSTADLILAS